MLQVVNMHRNPLGRTAGKKYLEQILQEENFGYNVKKALSKGEEALDNFYFLLKGNEMIGCCGMVVNEDMDEKSQKPWITSLHVNEEHRGNNYSEMLLNHVIHKAKLLGYESAYLAAGDMDYAPRPNWVKVKANTVSGSVYYRNLADPR